MKNTNENRFINNMICNYIGLDTKNPNMLKIFKEIFQNKETIIYGGFLRDNLHDFYRGIDNKDRVLPNDMDILTLNENALRLEHIFADKLGYEIEREGYPEKYDKLVVKPPINMTSPVDNRVVQLIRPRMDKYAEKCGSSLRGDDAFSIKQLYNFTSEVDMSCCGLIWTFEHGVEEVCLDAKEHANHKIFKVFPDHVFYTDRSNARIDKLVEKGWFQI